MSATQPNFTKAQLGVITTPTWIVDGDHDEAIKRENTEFMVAQIAASGLVLMAEVSHSASLQDPQQFAAVQRLRTALYGQSACVGGSGLPAAFASATRRHAMSSSSLSFMVASS